MTPEEKLNACNHLRRQICNELLRLEAFRQEVYRPGVSGGNIIIANTNFTKSFLDPGIHTALRWVLRT